MEYSENFPKGRNTKRQQQPVVAIFFSFPLLLKGKIETNIVIIEKEK